MHRHIIGNDSIYLVRNARSAETGGTIPISATGTLTVREMPAEGAEPGTGATLAGTTWPAVFAWMPTLNGFGGTILGSIAALNLHRYEITATLDGGAGLVWRKVAPMRAYAEG